MVLNATLEFANLMSFNVVHVGTNNLRKKDPLRPQELSKMRLLLQASLRTSGQQTEVLVVGIFRRADIATEQVEKSNELLMELVEKMNAAFSSKSLIWLEQPEEINTQEHLVDHAHLNEEGYRIWDAVLNSKLDEVVQHLLAREMGE